jgi:hypothetical protein
VVGDALEGVSEPGKWIDLVLAVANRVAMTDPV